MRHERMQSAPCSSLPQMRMRWPVLAALYAAAKDYPRAISLVGTAIAKAPASVDLREVMTNLYLLSGQPEKAQEQMRKIVELRPLELAPPLAARGATGTQPRPGRGAARAGRGRAGALNGETAVQSRFSAAHAGGLRLP